MLNFLSFLVLLYVSGHFKQKFFLKNFQTDRNISSPIHVVYSILKLFPWWLIFGCWLKADKKPSESGRLKSRLSVSATPTAEMPCHLRINRINTPTYIRPTLLNLKDIIFSFYNLRATSLKVTRISFLTS